MGTEPHSVLVRAEPMVELHGVYKRYGEYEVLPGIHLTVARAMCSSSPRR
jgi:ABC-type histidine transport system ATPase subunit